MVVSFDDPHFIDIIEVGYGVSSSVGSKFILHNPQTFLILDKKSLPKSVDNQLSEHIGSDRMTENVRIDFI